MNFWIKKKLILWISASKRRSFPTQETGTEMIFPWYLRNLHDFLRNEKDDISVLLGNIVFRARNFVQVNTLCNVVPEAANNFAQEKILCNVVLIFLGLYYTGQNFTQFYQSGCRQYWIRKSPVQCCLDTLGTTFNRPKFCAKVPRDSRKIAWEEILCKIVLILLGQHCTGQNLVQYCPKGSRQSCIRKRLV